MPACRVEAKRWRLGYGDLLIREDVRDLERVVSLDQIEQLYHRLPQIITSPISVNSLAEYLSSAHDSIVRWLKILEKLYACFFVNPYAPKATSGVKKERKVYLWDWSRVESKGGKLENLVALHLLRFIHWCEDALGERLELCYFKDVYGREVDFIIMRNKSPWITIEVKSSEEPLSKHLIYFLERSECKLGFQIAGEGSKYAEHKNATIRGAKCRVFSALVTRFLGALA